MWNDKPHDYTHTSKKYSPTWAKDVDFSPDHRPSDNEWMVEARGKAFLGALEVGGLGVLVLRASPNPATGRLQFNGVSLYQTPEFSPESIAPGRGVGEPGSILRPPRLEGKT